jgi:hypothetical protein
MKSKECCKDGNPFVAIPSVVLGIFLVVVILWLILAKEQLALLIPLVWGFVVLGIVALAFAHKAMLAKGKKK